MPRADGRIEPGQKLTSAISARAWNRAQQAADIVLGANTGFAAGSSQQQLSPYTWVYAKNTSGEDLARWGVMKIDGIQIEPTSTATARATIQFQEMPVLTGVSATSTSSTATGTCVAIEPIGNGKIGRVAVAGVVQLKKTDIGKVVDATVLWKNDTWALVRLGGAVRICTFTGAWAINSTKTVTVLNQTQQLTATNQFYNLSAECGERKCAVAADGATWYLIAYQCD